MLLSIITCTLNSEKYLQECLDSIVSQRLNSFIFEHIFVDSFSVDQTIPIIKLYEKKNSIYNIKIIQKQKKGVYNAMNEGIKEAKGEYVMILNSDDYLYPNVMKGYLDFIRKTGYKDYYCGRVDVINDQTHFNYKIPFHKFSEINNLFKRYITPFFGGCYGIHPSSVYKKELHEKFGYYNEKYKIAADTEFINKIFLHKSTHSFYKKFIQILRVHNNSISTAQKDIGLCEVKEINIKIFGKLYGGILNFYYTLIRNVFILFKIN